MNKNVNDNDRAIQCDLCNYWFSLTAITLIILTINSFKIPMILGIVFSVAAKLSYLILWKVIKTFPCVWVTFKITINQLKLLNNKSLLSLNPSENLKILVNQLNNASQEDNIDPKNATHEWFTYKIRKHLTKISHWPYFI